MVTSGPLSPGNPRFSTTSWTLVVDAGGSATDASRRALSLLVERYWHPLYAYLRRKGHGSDDAQDLVQAFFARFIEKGYVGSASHERGRFRSFLLSCLNHFVANEWDAARAKKRGGGVAPLSLDLETAESRFTLEPSHERTPQKEFERRWALTVLDRALARIAAAFEAEGREAEFEMLRPFLTGDLPPGAAEEVARRLGKTSGALKVAVHRLRRRYGDAVRAEVADTVTSPDDIDGEIQHLLEALAEG